MIDQSGIAIHGEAYRECRITIAAHIPGGVAVWIDDPAHLPIANLRLTEGDARALLKQLARALRPGVHGELIEVLG